MVGGEGLRRGGREGGEEGGRGISGLVGGWWEASREGTCACERVCVKDVLSQSMKDIEPSTHQLTCGPKVKTLQCAVLPQNL